MKLVTIESPYAGDVEANEEYLKQCLIDSSERGEAPFASHGFYTQYLDDDKPEERKLGMESGFAWGRCADLVAVYIDRGVTRGMIKGIREADKMGKPIEFRRLKDREKKPQPWYKWIPNEFENDDYMSKMRSIPPKEFERLYTQCPEPDKEELETTLKDICNKHNKTIIVIG